MTGNRDFKCYWCEASQCRRIATADAKTRESLNVMQCERCGLVQQYPLPAEQALRQYYSHNYRLDYKKAYVPRPRHILRAGKVALDRLAFLRSAGIDGGQLTDIGAGGGEFVFLAGQSGHAAHGLEPNLGYSEFARSAYQADVQTGGVTDLIPASQDVVTMFHVLEHIADPAGALEVIWRGLHEGGHLFVEVPNIAAADASPHNIYFKAHLFYFSLDTLRSIASPWFDVVNSDDVGNIRVVLRRRPTPVPRRLPDAASVANALHRVSSKGWIEYLTTGRGWRKPIERLRRQADERRVANMVPRKILASLLYPEAPTGKTLATRRERKA
ncbi:MAG: class I SAM-dependent methyltransferase [Burkholderiaceae bacterium]